MDNPLRLTPASPPSHTRIEGRYATLAPLSAAEHAEPIWQAVRGPEHDALWRYLFDGPYPSQEEFAASLHRKEASRDPLFFAIVNQDSGRPEGYASYLRIEPAHRVIEVGSILFAPPLQRTRAATEAMYLMARHAFEELGYRRYEWKCDSRNEPSRRAALRLGFTFEGIFRQHMIIKGGNRDTAWYAMLDSEWPARKAAFERWLDPSNFDSEGRQRAPLSSAATITGA